MATIVSLTEAVRELVHDGDVVALEGFTHLIPHAAGHEIARKAGGREISCWGADDLMTSSTSQKLIGMGCARRLVFSWGGNPGVGSLHRFRDAVEHDWPSALELEEHSHAGMAAAYVAGASNLPFGVLRGYAGSDLVRHTSSVTTISCPFTGAELAAVRALRPDVGVIHAQRADHAGNVQYWGIPGVHKEVVMASQRSLVTVEEVVPELVPQPGAVVLPSWTVTAVAVAPRGAHPSYAHGYYGRDNEFYRRWDTISRDRDTFLTWMTRHVMGTADVGDYHRSVAAATQCRASMTRDSGAAVLLWRRR